MSHSLSRSHYLLMLLLAVILLAATSCKPSAEAPKFDTDYQVVIMTNGQVLIGKIDALNTEYPVLREVYAVTVVTDPSDPKKSTNMLVSRSREAHQPAFTLLQGRNILLIEPITKGSRMAELIEQEKNNAAQQPK